MSGLGQTFRTNVLNYVLRGGTAPGRVATYYVSLHTGDPGVDGQTANEVSPTGTAYTRQAIASTTGWTVPGSPATPYALSNSAVITFPAATGAGYGTVTYFGIWNAGPAASGNNAAANYVGGGQLTSSQVINTGNTATIAIGALTLSVTTITATNTTGMCQGFRKLVYDYLLTAGSGGGTDPLAAAGATIYASLHTGDPGVDGLSNEASGGAYARASFARTGTPAFTSASAATPSVITNGTTAIAFPTATGTGYSAGAALTWFAIWRLSAAGAAGDCLLRGTMTSQTVLVGSTPSFATSTCSTQLEVT